MNFVTEIIRDEIRNNLGNGKSYGLVDMGGACFGLFFIFDAVRRLKMKKDVWATAELAVGSVMFATHSLKFFYREEMEKKE